MADTRTIFLLTPETVFCSDPSAGYQYLDVSEYSDLNPTRGLIVSGMAGAVASYEAYDATLTLSWKGVNARSDRAAWIQQNGDRVYQISVANTTNQSRVYNKKCAISGFEFLDNPFEDGAQTVLTLKMFGKWQSSLTLMPINTGEYTAGTKQFTTGDESPFTYVYGAALAYGSTTYASEINLEGEHGFVIKATPGAGLTLTIKSGYSPTVFQIESNYSNLITGLSTDFVAYPNASFLALDKFTMLEGGTVSTYGWNITANEYPHLYDLFNNADTYPISVGAVNQAGVSVPIDVYAFTAQDFI